MPPGQPPPHRGPAADGRRTRVAPAGGGRARIVVITGPSRAGKTTVCRQVVEAARRRGLSVAGVLTEDGVDAAGGALQIVRDLSSHECRLLARARRRDDPLAGPASDTRQPPRAPRPVDAFRLRWEFDAQGLAFGDRVLAAAAEAACELLVVDQIGPLEMRHRGGWTGAFELLRAGRFDLALVVVNPIVVEQFVAVLERPCQVIHVDETVRDSLPAAIGSAHLA